MLFGVLRRSALLAGVCCLPFGAACGAAFADDAADTSAEKVDEVVVTTKRDAIPENIPASIEGMSIEEIRDYSNAVTVTGMLKYLPSMTETGRYAGASTAYLRTRTTKDMSQTMIYADNLLLSDYMAASNGARLGAISPESIERIDVIYGPFSALYPGNSMGGVTVLKTHMPDKFEAHGSVKDFRTNQDMYGTHDSFDSYEAAASAGDRQGPLSFLIGGSHLDTYTLPITFPSVNVSSGVAPTTGTPVGGYYQDKDSPASIATSSVPAMPITSLKTT